MLLTKGLTQISWQTIQIHHGRSPPSSVPSSHSVMVNCQSTFRAHCRLAQWSSCKLTRSIGASWRPPSQRQTTCTCQVRGPGRKHSPPECQGQRRACMHLESASASHRGAAASLLDLSELHGGLRHKCSPLAGAARCLVLAASTLHRSASGKDDEHAS